MEKEGRDEGRKVWRRRGDMKEERYGEGGEIRRKKGMEKDGRDEERKVWRRKVWRRRGEGGLGGAKGGAKEERNYLNMYIVYCIRMITG